MTLRTSHVALWSAGWLTIGTVLLPCAVRAAAAPQQQAAPATRPAAAALQEPASPEVAALIDKLSDASPATRDDATAKLLKMGKPVLPALKASADTDDPELRARVRTLIRKLERRIPPAAPPATPGFQTHSVSASVNGSGKTIDVNDNGHKIHIDQKGDAIKMSVTGVDEDGKEATENYEAASPDELKEQEPEAYALYEKWGGNGAGGAVIIHNGAGVGGGGVIQLRAGQLRIGVNPPATRPATQPAGGAARGANAGADLKPNDFLNHLREMLRRQVEQGNLPADAQERMLRQLEDVERLQREAMDRARQLRELNDAEHGPKIDRPEPPQPPDAPQPAPAPRGQKN